MQANFPEFKALLKAATRAHYERYVAAHPGEDFYGYSLYSNDDVSSIGPVATRGSAMAVDRSDPMWSYYRFGPHEWNDWDDFGLFVDVNQALKGLCDSLDFDSFRSQSLEVSFEVLRELQADGLFGPKSENRYVVLWLSDSADPIMDRAAKELNCPSIYAAFSTEYGTPI